MKPYYDDGQLVIYLADCREVIPTLGRVDVLLTDPPYGMAYCHGARKGGVVGGQDKQRIVGDEIPFDPSHLLGIAKRTILWGANHYAAALPSSPGWLVWDKRDGAPSNDQSDGELAWTDFLRSARIHRQRSWGSVREGREQREPRHHVMQKPAALMAWCLRLCRGGGSAHCA